MRFTESHQDTWNLNRKPFKDNYKDLTGRPIREKVPARPQWETILALPCNTAAIAATTEKQLQHDIAPYWLQGSNRNARIRTPAATARIRTSALK
jgi:hypothetical protein